MFFGNVLFRYSYVVKKAAAVSPDAGGVMGKRRREECKADCQLSSPSHRYPIPSNPTRGRHQLTSRSTPHDDAPDPFPNPLKPPILPKPFFSL